MFVTFEGPEGAGKTTLIEGLRRRLESEDLDILVTREPGAGAVGRAIRDILLHGEVLDARAELFLFLADRAQHVASIVRPHLARRGIVLCDRYIDSTVVYQGYSRGLPIEELRKLNRFATDSLTPDLTFLLDIDPMVGLARIRSKDRLDSEPPEFHERVRQGFLSEAALAPKRIIVLDAESPPGDLLKEVYTELMKRKGTETRVEG